MHFFRFPERHRHLYIVYMRYFILLLTLILGSTIVYGQVDSTKFYQLSGLIISKTSEEAVPYVSIRVNRTRRGEVSNAEGFYSIPVTEDDTLYFSHVGFHTASFVIRDYLNSYVGPESQYIYAVNYMLEDTFTLEPVVIFPYNTPEEIKTAVVNMDILENTPEAFARQNLDPAVMHVIIQNLPKDGNERLMVGRQMYMDYYQQRNLLQTAGLDAMAAMRLLQYVVEKSKKRKNKDLNYWE